MCIKISTYYYLAAITLSLLGFLSKFEKPSKLLSWIWITLVFPTSMLLVSQYFSRYFIEDWCPISLYQTLFPDKLNSYVHSFPLIFSLIEACFVKHQPVGVYGQAYGNIFWCFILLSWSVYVKNVTGKFAYEWMEAIYRKPIQFYSMALVLMLICSRFSKLALRLNR